MPLLSNMGIDRLLIGGLAAGKKWASGSFSNNGLTTNVTVTGLNFTPRTVIAFADGNTQYSLVYAYTQDTADTTTKNFMKNVAWWITMPSDPTAIADGSYGGLGMNSVYYSKYGATFSSGQFTIPIVNKPNIDNSIRTYYWIAFE